MGVTLLTCFLVCQCVIAARDGEKKDPQHSDVILQPADYHSPLALVPDFPVPKAKELIALNEKGVLQRIARDDAFSSGNLYHSFKGMNSTVASAPKDEKASCVTIDCGKFRKGRPCQCNDPCSEF